MEKEKKEKILFFIQTKNGFKTHTHTHIQKTNNIRKRMVTNL